MQKAWQAWTCVDLGQKGFGQDGRAGRGGDPTDCAGVGFCAIRAGGFLPVNGARGCKTVAGAYFRGRGVAPSMTLKSYWVQKP